MMLSRGGKGEIFRYSGWTFVLISLKPSRNPSPSTPESGGQEALIEVLL